MTAASAEPVLSLELDAELQGRVRHLAAARQQTPHGLMREAIAEFVGRAEAWDRLRSDSLAAVADYQATGLHATGAEVDAWLARLEAGEAAEPPICHT